jgi:hypothetical protein
MAQRCAVPTRPGQPLWSGPRRAANTAGAFLFAPAPWGSAPWGRDSAGTKGAQGWGPESFSFARVEVLPKAEFLLAKENPEGGRRPSFRVPLRGGLPVLHCLPFARFPASLLLKDLEQNEFGKSNSSLFGRRPRGGER